MKIQELRQLTPKKLTEELQKTKRSLATAKFQTKTGKNQNFAQIKTNRRLIARILTLLGQPKIISETKQEK